jgi:hypothetical protein
MRIIKFLLKFLLLTTLVLVVALYASREVLLFIARTKLESGLELARDVHREQQYATECMKKGGRANSAGKVHQTQLRFVNDNEFVVEAVCHRFEFTPIEVDRWQLPRMVHPKPGQSGLVWDEAPGSAADVQASTPAAINVQSLNRTSSVAVRDGVIYQQWQATEVPAGTGPKSECASFGYQCCDLKYQQGVGEQMDQILDCPKSCYESCVDRPVVLSFNTQPVYDTMSRTLDVSSGQTVTFHYTVSANQNNAFGEGSFAEASLMEKITYFGSVLMGAEEKTGSLITVTLDFGDGQKKILADEQGEVTHQYQCTQSNCQYQAQIMVENQEGIQSYQGERSQVKIKVR